MFEIEGFTSSVTIKKEGVTLNLDNGNFLTMGNGVQNNKSWYLEDAMELRTDGNGNVEIEDLENGEAVSLTAAEWGHVILNAEKIPKPVIEYDKCTLCYADVYGHYHYSCPTIMDRVKLFCQSSRGKRIVRKMADLTRSNISSAMKRGCTGCKFDKPSQMDHECLLLSYDKRDTVNVMGTYFSEAYARIDRIKIDELSMSYPNNNCILQDSEMFTVFRACVKKMVYDLLDLEYSQ